MRCPLWPPSDTSYGCSISFVANAQRSNSSLQVENSASEPHQADVSSPQEVAPPQQETDAEHLMKKPEEAASKQKAAENKTDTKSRVESEAKTPAELAAAVRSSLLEKPQPESKGVRRVAALKAID